MAVLEIMILTAMAAVAIPFTVGLTVYICYDAYFSLTVKYGDAIQQLVAKNRRNQDGSQP